MADRMRCPKCGNWRKLSLVEIHEESGATDFGVIVIDSFGALVPPSNFWFEPGESIAAYIDCNVCGHQWKPRRQSIAPSTTGQENER